MAISTAVKPVRCEDPVNKASKTVTIADPPITNGTCGCVHPSNTRPQKPLKHGEDKKSILIRRESLNTTSEQQYKSTSNSSNHHEIKKALPRRHSADTDCSSTTRPIAKSKPLSKTTDSMGHLKHREKPKTGLTNKNKGKNCKSQFQKPANLKGSIAKTPILQSSFQNTKTGKASGKQLHPNFVSGDGSGPNVVGTSNTNYFKTNSALNVTSTSNSGKVSLV